MRDFGAVRKIVGFLSLPGIRYMAYRRDMKPFLAVLVMLLAACGAGHMKVGPVDLERVLPLDPRPEYSTWWQEVTQLASVTPATDFARVSWWSLDDLHCPAFSPETCVAHGLFIAPKDIILAPRDVANRCWVEHEMVHVILGRGDEAHGHPLFEAIKQSCRSQQ